MGRVMLALVAIVMSIVGFAVSQSADALLSWKLEWATENDSFAFLSAAIFCLGVSLYFQLLFAP